MQFRSILAVLCLVLLSACNDDKPASPSPNPTPSQINLSGRWTGDVTTQGVTGRMTWTLTQSGTAVTGPVTVGLTSGTVLLNGFLQGTVSGSSLSYTITVGPGNVPNQPSCTGQVGGSMSVAASVQSMTGNIGVTSSTCVIQFSSNNVTLTKQ